MTRDRERNIRVLVIDDSPANRRAIAEILEGAPGIEVVDRAADGDEGLKKVEVLSPDVVTLDLEMPRLDGFTFLRLLKARAPTPVIVLSSYAHQSDVFKALELGAFDFVAKPASDGKASLESVRADLVAKVRAVRQLGPQPPMGQVEGPEPMRPKAQPPVVVAVGASTGGPPAIQHLVGALQGTPVALLVCQHMPPRFTKAFAERLDALGALTVKEAQAGDEVRAGSVYVAPGGKQLELVDRGGRLELSVCEPAPGDKHAPSVDRLFASVAKAIGRSARAIVLTGMGEDGELGVRAVAEAGGEVWAESQESAVIYGMPRAAIATGRVRKVLGLRDLCALLASQVRTWSIED